MRVSNAHGWLPRTGLFLLVLVGVAWAQGASVATAVLDNTPQHVVLRFDFASPRMETVNIAGVPYVQLSLERGVRTCTAGAPELPKAARSIILPDTGGVSLRVVSANYTDLTDLAVAPSKGLLLRTVNPDDVPYTFGPEYSQDAYYPGALAEVGEPYILRDYRGAVVTIYPVQYNPVQHTLRVYSDITVEVLTNQPGGVNELDRSLPQPGPDASFEAIYREHFVNSSSAGLQRYNPLNEDGNLLIICHDAWLGNIQPLVTHKTAHGVPTTAVGVATIGNTATAIKTYIQNTYNAGGLAYVLLVGDSTQIATPSASGGASDPSYAKLAGNDNYPDIIVGRFSAETAAQVDTQVQRTIAYETLPAPTQDWFWKGVGIASSQGAGQGDEGQADYVHIGAIRTQLLGCGYTLIDEIYDTNGGTAQMVSNAVNAGRGVINYCGHGSTNAWSSTGFSSTNVSALTNQGKLPFIFSVACVNGDFDGQTCFAEAWLRAAQSGQPTGAVATYMSSINQSWAPPMQAQDEFANLICAEAYTTVGALYYASSCSMIDAYGSGGADMFNTWHIFGDPSLHVAITCSDQGTITLDAGKYACQDVVTVLVSDCGLNTNDNVADTATVTVTSTSDPVGQTVTITENGPASGQFVGTCYVNTTGGGGVLVTSGDTLTATYIDADNGQGGTNLTVQTTAAIDCTGPAIANVHTSNLQARSVTIDFNTNEPAKGTVRYGFTCAALTSVASSSGFATAPSIPLSGLTDNRTYYYKVEAVDEAGNLTVDPTCYTFTTPEVPDYYTQLFTTDNDLRNITLQFTPNGSVDFYRGCAQAITALPTDPTGGTALAMSDDNSLAVTLTGGATVKLYGTSYGAFYVGANGYITFGSSDTSYNESLSTHFSKPRVAALFDDLDPSSGGQVSWKQLADKAVVTWLNVPERSATTTNTFQIELYFDGRITVSYLAVAATDGLAGLARGNGQPSDFLMSDLSALGPCQTFPPVASDVGTAAGSGQAKAVNFVATDDGMPSPPGVLTYVVTALPLNGLLRDAGNGAIIAAVPYPLVNSGKQVSYTSDTFFVGNDTFTFRADDGGTAPDGGASNAATVTIAVGPVKHLAYSWPLDSDPGWNCEGLWQFGTPTGGGTHGGDPTGGHTGANVYGYKINGDYTSSMTRQYLTTTAIDCQALAGAELRFWRWLGIQNLDHAGIDVSHDGTNWVNVWEYSGTSQSPTTWTQCTYDLSAVADGFATVYVRWGMGTTDTSITYPGWNIDDIEVWGMTAPAGCAGDANCDGTVNWRDIDYFVAGMNDQSIGWRLLFQPGLPTCAYRNLDTSGDGHVNWRDIDPLIARMNAVCP